MNNVLKRLLVVSCIFLIMACKTSSDKIPVIFDTDANNELDDQHALAYLLFNGNTFDIKGVTTNATYNGGHIDEHNKEAERILKLCDSENKIPLLKGANGDFNAIKSNIKLDDFDGNLAVNFMIDEAKKRTSDKLVILAVGKLTNIALAVKKDSSIINKIRLVWLGSNYPEAGEYNLDNDIPAMNFLLNSQIEFEMVTVRYGKPTGTDVVKVTKDEIIGQMKGRGPKIETPIIGRHGGNFSNFGDYSINLFEHVDYYGNPPSRSLFDMAAVAIVKNPEWAIRTEVPCPIMVDKKWVDQPKNTRKIILWENFNKEKIMTDFYNSMLHYVIVD